MSDTGEVIGSVAEGALLARAVEPGHGEAGDDGHTHERACLNCGTVLAGSHCHTCGQAAHVHKTLGAFFHDLVHGVFHFEGKIWRTLPMLAWKPGQLTREYIDGRRASYVSPIALFLFVVFLTFATFNMLKSGVEFNTQSNAQIKAEAHDAAVEAEAEVARLEDQLADARAGRGGDPAKLEQELAAAREAAKVVGAVDTGKLPDQIAVADGKADQAITDKVNEAWRKAKKNPDLMIYKLQSSIYKYAWLIIPLSVPFVWLLFPFSRRFHLYDHTVFVTYSVSFMLILGMAISLLIEFNWTAAAGVLGCYVPFHLYRQTRGTYGLTRMGAVWRTALLIVFAQIVMLLFSTAMALLVAAG